MTMRNFVAPQEPVILRASEKDARRTSTSTRAINPIRGLAPVRAQHFFTLSLEECAPCPQGLHLATILPGTHRHV
jgi:hypothetical protein